MSSVRWPTGGANWQSQQLSHSNDRAMKGRSGGKSHSWWWDSHNAPKNSKWLEDNLNDMDSKVKAMLKLIEEDADSFAKRAEMYYKKRPELVSLVEEFYRAYRSLAERYDQLTGHIRQIPQEIQAQFGFSGDAPPGSPVSGGSVRRRAAGFSAFASPGTPKRSQEKNRKDGSDSSSSSSSDSDADSKRGKSKHSGEILRIQEENEQLRMDLEKGIANHQALESRLTDLQEELKALQHQNVQLHRNAASAQSEIAALEAEIERLKRENFALGEEASSAARTAEKLQNELDISQDEQRRLSIRLEETDLYIQGLEPKIKEMEVRILQLNNELSSSTASCERLERDLTVLREERSTLLNNLSDQASRIIELEEEIARLRASLSLAECERERHFELHQTLERTLADVHMEFSSVREERGKLSEELLVRVQHVQSLEEQLNQVREALERSEREKADALGLLNNVESSLADLQNEFGSMQERLNGEVSVQAEEKHAFKVQVEELQAAMAALHSEKSRGVELQDILEKRIVELELHLKETQEAFQLSETEKTVVIGHLSRLETSFSQLQDEFGCMQERLTAEISVQAQEKQTLNAQVEELQAALEALHGEKSREIELQDVRLVDLEVQLKQAQEALALSESEGAEVSGLLTKLQTNFSELQDEFGTTQERLNGEILIHAQEKEILKEQASSADLMVERLQKELDLSRAEQCRLSITVEESGVYIQGLEAKIKEVEEGLLQLSEQLSSSTASCDRLERELTGLREERDTLLQDVSAQSGRIVELEEENVRLRASLTLAESERERHFELHQSLKKMLADVHIEFSSVQEEKEKLSEELFVKVQHVQSVEQHLNQVQEALEGSEREKADVVGLLSKTESSLSDLQNEFGSMQERLHGEISAQSEEKHAFKVQAEELQATLAALHNERSRGVELQDILEKRLVQLELQLKEAQEALLSSETEKAEVTGILSNVQTSFAQLQDEFGSMQERLRGEITVQSQDKQALSAQVEELEAALRVLDGERSRGVELQDVLEKRLMDLEDQLKQVQEALESSEREKAEVVGLLRKAEGSLADLQNEFGSMKERLNGEISVQVEETHAFKIQVEELRAALAALHGERSRGVDLQNVLEQRLLELELQLKQTQEALQSSEAGNAEVKAILSNVESSFAQLQDEFGSMQERLTGEISVQAQENDALNAQVEELQAALSALRGERSRGVELQDVLEKRLMDLELQLKQVQEALESSEKERSELSGLLSNVQTNLSELQDAFSSMQERLNGEKDVLIGQVEKLQATLAALDGEKSRGIELQDVLEKRLIEIQQELSQAKQEASSLSDELADRAAIVLHLEGEVRSQDETVGSLQGALLAKQQEREILRSQLDDCSRELQTFESEVQRLRSLLAESEDLTKRLGTQILEIQQDLESGRLEADRLRNELDEKVAVVGKLEGEAENRDMLIANLRDEISSKLEEGQILRERLNALIEEKASLTDENLLNLDEIAKLKKELEEHVNVFQIKEESMESQILKLKAEIQDLDKLCKEFAKKLEDKTNEQEVLEADKQELQQALVTTQQERASAFAKCDTLIAELAQEHESRIIAEEASAKFQAEIVGLLAEIARLQAELDKFKEENEALTVQVEAALEQERVDAKEIEALLKALQGVHEGNGSSEIGERSWHFEAKHSTFRHLKESMVNLLTDSSRIRQEAAAHAEHVKALNLEIEKSGQMLDTSRGDYHTLLGKHDATLIELQALQLRISRLEGQVTVLEEEKKKLHDQLLASVRDSDELSADLLREKKELYEKLVVEGEHVLKLQQELKMVREETVENKRIIDDLHKQIEKLLLDIEDIVKAKEEQEKCLRQEVQNHVEEKATMAQSLTEALGALSFEKTEVLRYQEEISFKDQQVVKLEEEIALLKATLSEKEQEFLVLDEEFSNIRQLHIKLQSDHECLATEKQRSFDEHSLTVLRLEKVETDLNFQQGENSRLEAELRNTSARIEDLVSIISKLEKEKKAFSVEIASTGLLMNDVQRRANDLQEEMNQLRQELTSSNEQLQQKKEEIQELSSISNALQEEKTALGLELEMKIQDFGSLEANLCALQNEHLTLVDKYEILTEEAASGANLIQKLKEEISQLRVEKEAQDQVLFHRKADIQRLEEDLSLVQDSEKQLRKLLDIKEQETIHLEEELNRLKAALFSIQEDHKQSKETLEIELKRLELVVIRLRDEKVSLGEQHALSLGRYNDLEALCKSLQQQLAEHHAEKRRLEAQLSLIDELRKEALDEEEMVRLMQERVASKQHEIDQVQSINEDLKEIMGKFESEMEGLKQQISSLQKQNTLLTEDVSAKASLIQELDQSFTNLKEEKVVFEGGFTLAVGNVGLVQAEVDKLLEKISKLSELSLASAESLQKMEDRICKLQVSNLNLGDEISGLAKKERSYVIAVRFMRAEFFCLVQRIKAMKEEKVELSRLAELAMEAERKKNGEVLSGLQQELAFLREENKRQRGIIFDRAEEKREAIRQLCATIDYMQNKNRRLEGAINSVRERIQRRIEASSSRRN